MLWIWNETMYIKCLPSQFPTSRQKLNIWWRLSTRSFLDKAFYNILYAFIYMQNYKMHLDVFKILKTLDKKVPTLNQQSLEAVLICYNLFLIYNNGFSNQWIQLSIYMFKAVTIPSSTYLAASYKLFMLSFHFHSIQNIFFNFPCDVFFDLGYLEMCCLIFRFLGISQISVVAF